MPNPEKFKSEIEIVPETEEKEEPFYEKPLTEEERKEFFKIPGVGDFPFKTTKFHLCLLLFPFFSPRPHGHLLRRFWIEPK